MRRHYLSIFLFGPAIMTILSNALLADQEVKRIIDLDPFTIQPHSLQLIDQGFQETLERMASTPGGVNLISTEMLNGQRSGTLIDALGSQAGVIARSYFGGNDQTRLCIRGSGLQQNPVQRGVEFLLDGLPLNLSDGTFIIGAFEARTTRYIEIYRGGNAVELGSTTLGGAIHFVSPDGRESDVSRVRIEGGSFGYLSSLLTTSGKLPKGDYYAGFTYNTRNGYRDFSNSERFTLNTNYGFSTENLESRFYLYYTDLGFDVAGPLPKSVFESDPKSINNGQGGANVRRDKPHRDTTQLRFSNRTSLKLGEGKALHAALGYLLTDDQFRYPIPKGFIDTDSDDLSAMLMLHIETDKTEHQNLLKLGIRAAWGKMDRVRDHNNKGIRGERYAANDLNSDNLTFFANNTFHFLDKMALTTSIQYSRASRDSTDRYDLPTRPTLRVKGQPIPDSYATEDTSFDFDYDEVCPRVGLLYELDNDTNLFVNLSRSFEPPTFEDLFKTTKANPNTGPQGFKVNSVDKQTADTVEFGIRRQNQRLNWDVVFYRASLEHELLAMVDESGVKLGTVNAGDTIHQGVELEFTLKLTEQWSSRLVYNYQDFHFVDDARFGDNRLGAIPEHMIHGALSYSAPQGFFAVAQILWSPEETAIDNAGNLYQDSYSVTDLRVGYKGERPFKIFVEIRNLFDELYASATPARDVGNLAQAAYLPGDGRGFYAGFDYRF